MKKGFTLIELLVVISIIGLLSSVVLTSLNSARARARIAAAQTTMRGIHGAALLCDGLPALLVTGSITMVTSNICTNTTQVPGAYPRLPTGWDYNSTVDATAGDGVFQYSATGDGKTITCTGAGCVTP